MVTKFTPHQYLWMILVAFLIGCTPTQSSVPDIQTKAVGMAQTRIALTQTAIPTITPLPPTVMPTATSVIILSTPPPTQPPIPLLTPDATQVVRWKEYQTELAKVILSYNPELVHDPEIYKDALCEWDILGQAVQEVYVYAVCVVANSNRGARRPAIIYLELDGSIREVKLPERKGADSEEFNYDPFPGDVQAKFCYYFDPFPSDLPRCPYGSAYPRPRLDVLYAHIEYRKTHPDEPPLVVLSANSTATSAP